MAFIDDRPFDQCGHFVQQRFGHQNPVAFGFFVEHGADAVFSCLKARNDLASCFQCDGIVVGSQNADFSLRQEAVSVCRAAGRQAEKRDRDDVFTVHGNDFVHGTDEFDRFAIRTLIGHHFRNGQIVCGFFDRFLERAGQRDAAGGVVVEKAVVFAVSGHFQCGDIDVGDVHGRQFLFERCGRLAFGVKCHGNGQDFPANGFVRRDIPDIGDGDRQTAGGGIYGFFRGIRQKVVLPEAFFNRACEGIGQFGQCLGGQFFGQKFDKQGLVHFLSLFLFIAGRDLSGGWFNSVVSPVFRRSCACRRTWEIPALHGIRNRPVPQGGTGYGCGRYRRPVPSRTGRPGHPAD